MEWSYIVDIIINVVKVCSYSILGFVIIGGSAYYLLVVRRRRKWYMNIKELKADGKLYLVGKDIVYEKKINHGKQIIYLLKYRKAEVMPPPSECIDRFDKKEYCDYVRIHDEYKPIISESNIKEEEIKGLINQLKSFIGKITVGKSNAGKHNDYAYFPLDAKKLVLPTTYKPIDYDVNMMRINLIDSREQLYQTRKKFWEQYGPIIMIGAMVVGVIVIAWFGFEYANKVIQANYGQGNQISEPINRFLQTVGAKPPS